MGSSLEIIGVYPVYNNNQVYLIEVDIKDSNKSFDLTEITQEIPRLPKENWQVPWDEKLLDQHGENIIADCVSLKKEPTLWIGNPRIVFFFHFLDFSKPLVTPFGLIKLPEETPIPQRLSHITYESPD